MSKLIDNDKIAKLAKKLDDRAAAKVQLEEDRAIGIETALQENISNIEAIIDNNNKYRINAFDIGLQTGSSFDCTSLLQAKIDELYNLGGGIIEFPAGSYYFKGTIMLRPKVQIQGVSDTTDFISSTNIHGTVFYHNPDVLSDFFILDDTHKYAGYVESIVIKNLRIFGKENYSNVCMNLQGIAHSIIENISMTGFNKDLKVSDSITTTFRNLNCINAKDIVLEVTRDTTISTTTNFYDCYFGQSYSGKALVINANSCLNCNFINCVFESTQEGLFIETGNIVSFNNIYIENIPCVIIEGTDPTAPAINVGLNSDSNLTSELIFNGGFISGGNGSVAVDSKLISVDNINKLAFIGVQFARAESLINMTNNTKKVIFISCNEVQITNGLYEGNIRSKCDIIGCYSSAHNKGVNNSFQNFDMNGYQIKNEFFRTPNDLQFTLKGESNPTLMMDNNKNVQLFGRNTNYSSITGGGAFIINPTNPQVAGALNSSLMYAKEVDGEIVLHEFTSKRNNKPILFVNSGTSDERPTTGRYIGLIYFDTTLGRPIYWNGTDWSDILYSVDLNTEDKTIVGAINELDSEVFDIAANIISMDAYKADKTYVDEQLSNITNNGITEAELDLLLEEILGINSKNELTSVRLGNYQMKYDNVNDTLDFLYNSAIDEPTVNSYVREGLSMYIDANDVATYGSVRDITGKQSITNHGVSTTLDNGCLNFVANESDYIDTGLVPNLTTWSAEVYFYFTDTPGAVTQVILGWGATGNKIRIGYSDSYGTLVAQSNNEENRTIANASDLLSPLHHLIVTMNNGALTSYLDGVKTVLCASGGIQTSHAGTLKIGSKYNGTEQFANIHLKSLRFYDGKVLTDEEALQNYKYEIKNNYVTNGLSMYIDANDVTSYGSIRDITGKQNITNHGVSTTLNNGCLNFVASESDYLDCGFKPNLTKWSAEMYFYFTNSETGTLLSWGARGNRTTIAIWNNDFMIAINDDVQHTIMPTAPTSLAHLVLTYNNGRITAYVNGVKSQITASANVMSSQASNLMIGTKYSASDDFGNIHLKSLRFYDGKVLTEEEALRNYNYELRRNSSIIKPTWKTNTKLDDTGMEITSEHNACSDFIPYDSSYDYTLAIDTVVFFRVFTYDSSKAFISKISIEDNFNGVITPPSNTAYIRLKLGTNNMAVSYSELDNHVVLKKVHK